MPHFIDSLVNVKREFNGRWYIAKPLGDDPIPVRIRDAWKVLTGEYLAVSFFHERKDGKKIFYPAQKETVPATDAVNKFNDMIKSFEERGLMKGGNVITDTSYKEAL